MHFVTTRSFKYAGTEYVPGDGIYGSTYSAISQDVNHTFYSFFVVLVSDGETQVSDGSGSGNNSGGPSDMPFATGYYSIPAGASTSGAFSASPVRILAIRNTDSIAQGAVVNLWDCASTSDISAAHKIGGYQLGPTQSVPVQILTQIGLCWSISVGDGSNATTDNQSGLALNSTGGVDIDKAAV